MKKVIIYFSVFLLLLFVGCSPEYADYKGWAAYDSIDYVTAFKKFRPLAEQGNELAQYNLGALYYNGHGVPRDYVMAYMWLNLAASQGEETASDLRSIVEQYMTPEQIAEAQRFSREFAKAQRLSRELKVKKP